MKKFVYFILIVVLLVGLSSPAFAGIFSSAKDWVLNNAIETILTLVFMVVAGFFGGTVWGKIALRAKLPIYEAKDIILAVHDAKKADSPGGKDMTTEERAYIWKQVEEFAASVIKAAGGKV